MEMPNMCAKQRVIFLAQLISTVNIMICSILMEVEIITSIPYALKVYEERNQKSLALPSGQRCRNCASDSFFLKETLQMDNISSKPVMCEKYECDKCGREVEYCKYSS
jgi:dynactin complex subunit